MIASLQVMPSVATEAPFKQQLTCRLFDHLSRLTSTCPVDILRHCSWQAKYHAPQRNHAEDRSILNNKTGRVPHKQRYKFSQVLSLAVGKSIDTIPIPTHLITLHMAGYVCLDTQSILLPIPLGTLIAFTIFGAPSPLLPATGKVECPQQQSRSHAEKIDEKIRQRHSCMESATEAALRFLGHCHYKSGQIRHPWSCCTHTTYERIHISGHTRICCPYPWAH